MAASARTRASFIEDSEGWDIARSSTERPSGRCKKEKGAGEIRRARGERLPSSADLGYAVAVKYLPRHLKAFHHDMLTRGTVPPCLLATEIFGD
jgi:hypothetical protein